MQENETASTQPQSEAESQTTPTIPLAAESGKQPETPPVTPAVTAPVIPSGADGKAKQATAPKPGNAPKTPVTPAVTAPVAAKVVVAEDKTFTHSMDTSEKLTVKGADLDKVYVIEKYLKTGTNTRIAEKMTGALVPVHKDDFENYMYSLNRLGNIETKILHSPE